MSGKIVEKKTLEELYLKFTLRFGATGYHIDVYIWKTIDALYKNTGFKKKNYSGCYLGSDTLEDLMFGEIHLLLEMIGSGYVAHELFHAVFDWMYMNKFKLTGYDNLDNSLNESAAYILSDITSDFWRIYYDHLEEKGINVYPAAIDTASPQ
jgi:hypothetical protein